MAASTATHRDAGAVFNIGLRNMAVCGDGSIGRHSSPVSMTLDDLRRYAVARSLFPQTTLQRALNRMGFVQADPIRAPARAQDLTLRHRVRGYRAGDLERRYGSLDLHED